MSHIYDLTSGIIVTSFQVGSITNLDMILARCSGTCVQSFAFLSYRIVTLSTPMYVRGQLYEYALPPPSQWPAGGAEAQWPPR